MSAVHLLDRLERVKQTAPGRWIAHCPAHEDRSPSLSIRELEDGRVLLHDFGGCDTAAVLDAIGLTMAVLFPKRLVGNGPTGGFSPSHSKIPARDLLNIVDHELTVAALILADVLRECTVSAQQWARLATAAALIGKARDHGRS